MSAHYDSVIGAPGANDNASGLGLICNDTRWFSK
ncbi:unnamed protein product [Bacillus thuringiensis DB27]|uniref:Peptidase M28 domain-containing protein n=1 Tax=Bacillus thuringiensis DB27 TaxID=1431339 RepID=W8ZB41_BACTU|nr:M28 family peptidase [Bacillus thuringiensis]CDN39680.1 unnamed protein product [Bacillus thuringiensis DB27]